MSKCFRFDALWLPEALLSPAYVGVDEAGDVLSLGEQAPAAVSVEECGGLALAGIPNLHSHAFQRGIVGRTEHRGSRDDSFWTWREAMYRSVRRLTPEDVQAISAWVYAEMLESGYTSVAEFHYLHHDLDGRPYAHPAELALRVLEGARAAGIGVTLLPVLYAASGFSGDAPLPEQGRFASDVDLLLRIVEGVRVETRGDGNAGLGVAPHSLRAVPAAMLRDLLQAVPGDAPVHIHISEQTREVQACRDATGRTPIDYLLAEVGVDSRFCLVHATHASDSEVRALADTGAAVALCPTTEANLGDGFAPARELLAAGVPIAIGSDSQVSVCPMEELRALEYQSRLTQRRRNVLASRELPSVAHYLLGQLARSAPSVTGRKVGALQVGARADIVVLDAQGGALAGAPKEHQIDAWVFGGRSGAVRDVMVGGQWVVRGGRHLRRAALLTEFLRVMKRLD